MLANDPKFLVLIEEVAQKNLDILKQEKRDDFVKAAFEATTFGHVTDPLRVNIAIRTNSSGLILELAAREDRLHSGQGSFVFMLSVESSKDLESSKGDFFAQGTKLKFSSFGTKLAVGRRMERICEKMSELENVS